MDANTQRKLATSVVVLGVLAIAAPVLVFAYLPMTDLPQHLAIASILKHHGEARFGFDAYYALDWFHTPYVLPYALAVLVSTIAPLAFAMKLVVFLSVIAYPIGVAMVLRATRKPMWLALLAIPLAYNRSFFWGFINFNLAIGLALCAFACFVEPRKTLARDACGAVLVLAATFCHVYGLAMIAGLVVAHAIVGGGLRDLRARPWTTVPLLVGAALWVWKSGVSHGYGAYSSPPLAERIGDLPSSVLGGYRDASELVCLLVLAVTWLSLAWPALPFTRARLRALVPIERVALAGAAANLIAYLTLPEATWTAKFVHFRHAFLACSLLPVVARPAGGLTATAARFLLAVSTIAAIVNAWVHLAMFDREAHTFDPIVASLPDSPKVVSLIVDNDGSVMQSHPYLHFAAYAQAEKGGIISMTFPDVFWNLPVQMRKGAGGPKSPSGFEWTPSQFNDHRFGYFYDWAIVRSSSGEATPLVSPFPFELVLRSPPWYLYKHIR